MCRRKGTRVTSIPVGRELLSGGDLGDGEGGGEGCTGVSGSSKNPFSYSGVAGTAG